MSNMKKALEDVLRKLKVPGPQEPPPPGVLRRRDHRHHSRDRRAGGCCCRVAVDAVEGHPMSNNMKKALEELRAARREAESAIGAAEKSHRADATNAGKLLAYGHAIAIIERALASDSETLWWNDDTEEPAPTPEATACRCGHPEGQHTRVAGWCIAAEGGCGCVEFRERQSPSPTPEAPRCDRSGCAHGRSMHPDGGQCIGSVCGCDGFLEPPSPSQPAPTPLTQEQVREALERGAQAAKDVRVEGFTGPVSDLLLREPAPTPEAPRETCRVRVRAGGMGTDPCGAPMPCAEHAREFAPPPSPSQPVRVEVQHIQSEGVPVTLTREVFVLGPDGEPAPSPSRPEPEKCPECGSPATKDARGEWQRHARNGARLGCAIGWDNPAQPEPEKCSFCGRSWPRGSLPKGACAQCRPEALFGQIEPETCGVRGPFGLPCTFPASEVHPAYHADLHFRTWPSRPVSEDEGRGPGGEK